ncbi:MAG: FAD-binding oxidoreductase [Alphaproteobacteria bacterium]|nr:FAD-binding oxidoreductase [Alphaproteobacteria bacterium]
MSEKIDYIDTYYSRTLGAVATYPELVGNCEADVCVIGGGLAGLNTALGLVERGLKPVLLEARRIGWGASGRNGGFVLRGFDAGDIDIPGRVPPDQKFRIMKGCLDAQDLIRQRSMTYSIPCDIVSGSLAVTWGTDTKELEDDVRYANDTFDMGLEFWSRQRVQEHCRTPRYYAGVFSKWDFHFHPLRYTHGIAAAASSQGARIYEQSAALKIKKDGADWCVQTAGGQVKAKHVVVCTSVYGSGFDRKLDFSVFPVQTYVMVTKPVDRHDLDSTINTPYCVYDLRFACDYYRVLPDRRILWGGRVGLHAEPKDISALMLADMFKVYPQLKGRVEADISWAGRQAYTPYRMPVIGQRKPGYWYNTAFGGHGMVPTTLGGELIARAIAGHDGGYRDFDRYGLLFTGGPFGRYVAQAVYSYWCACDYMRYEGPFARRPSP